MTGKRDSRDTGRNSHYTHACVCVCTTVVGRRVPCEGVKGGDGKESSWG